MKQDPVPGVGLDLDRAAVLLDDPVADREAQPGPLADRLGGEERVEDPLADRRVDAAAGVGDLDPDALGLGLGPVRIVTRLRRRSRRRWRS